MQRGWISRAKWHLEFWVLAYLLSLSLLILWLLLLLELLLLCWFDTIICQIFYLRPQVDQRGHVSLLGGKILAGNYIIRDSTVFKYIESTFCNVLTVPLSTIFCISCINCLPGIWSIKIWVPFLIMPRAYKWGHFDLQFVHFCNLNLKIFIFRNLLGLFEVNIFICWNCNIHHDVCILFEIFLVMSGRFALIYLSVLIKKSHRIVTSVLPVTGCGVCLCHFSVWGRLKYLHNIQCMK